MAAAEPAPLLAGHGVPLDAISRIVDTHASAVFAYRSFANGEPLYRGAGQTSNTRYYRSADVRAGAGALALGFNEAADSLGVTVLAAPGYASPFFVHSFTTAEPAANRYLFNIGALAYDDRGGCVTPDYVTPLAAAAKMNLAVVTPTSHAEVQHVTLLSLALAHHSRSHGAMHLYDGIQYSQTVHPMVELEPKNDILEEINKSLPPGGSDVQTIIDTFNKFSELKLSNFQYTGSLDAETIFVTYGSLESQLFRSIIDSSIEKVALISVRIPLPFQCREFISLLPQSVKKIVVIGQSLTGTSPSSLKTQVASALFYNNYKGVTILDYVYQPSFTWSPKAVELVISEFVPSFENKGLGVRDSFIYWGNDNDANVTIPNRLAHALSKEVGNSVYLKTKYDNVANAGTIQVQCIISENQTDTLSNIDSAATAIVENAALLDVFDVSATIKRGGNIILVVTKTFSNENFDDIAFYTQKLGLPVQFLKAVARKEIDLALIDGQALSDDEHALSFAIQAAYWKFVKKVELEVAAQKICDSTSHDDDTLASKVLDSINKIFPQYVKEVPKTLYEALEKTDSDTEAIDEQNGNRSHDKDLAVLEGLPIFATQSSFGRSRVTLSEPLEPRVSKSSEIGKILTFSEAFEAKESLRPDLSVKNYVVKVKENRRVTPAEYDRNIFHIEFDISGTGLKYDIGEALGIHARNDQIAVKSFLDHYGLNDNDIVFVPNRENNADLEARTVLQAFTDNLDLFGKPPKRFYESLIEYTSNDEEKKELERLISPQGSEDLKKYQDIEFYTYVDIFKLFPSARPPLEKLVSLVAPLKRREYSIASSQKVHPNEVHLLIVVVDWIDNLGRKRYGQASKYISDLKVGSELVVSVKPSVMKLPPSPKQPVILSGLGTGLAPFKAIVEEKIWQKQQGYEIGDVFLFLGSRHKKEEYLYGELWEAYKDAGIITHIGAAFSRDQPEKIYIQDRIRQCLDKLKVAMIDQKGTFYLCGPTWPVPDITSALQDILLADAEQRGIKVDLDAAIEELKESSRYILEVY